MFIKKNKLASEKSGFTIVELLVVIVVIGILAAIAIVAYSGVQRAAVISALQSDLRNSVTLLATDYTSQGTYPSSIASVDAGKGLPKSVKTVYQYTSTDVDYCLSATSPKASGASFHVSSQNGGVQEGVCDGHSENPGTIDWNEPILARSSACSPSYFAVTFDFQQILFNCSSFASPVLSSIDGGATFTQKSATFASYGNPREGLVTANGDIYFRYGANSSSQSCLLRGNVLTNFASTINASCLNASSITAMAISSDGSKIAYAGSTDGTNVRFSTNSGSSFTVRTVFSGAGGSTGGLAMSKDGNICYAIGQPNSESFRRSLNGCVTWTTTTLPERPIVSPLLTSDDGAVVVLIASAGNKIYTSTDYGATFVARATPGSTNLSNMSMSGDGSRLLTYEGGKVFYSSDLGETWTEYANFGSRSVLKASVSPDGKKVLILTGGSGLTEMYRGDWN